MALVAFDLDGTLIDQAGAAREWVEEFVIAWDLPASTIDGIAAQLAQRRRKDEIFDSIASTWSLPISGALLWDAYRRRMPELVRCPEPTKRALRNVRAAGWTVGIVSNGMTDNQERKIRNTGLAELVDGWVISDEVGYRKPDPHIFLALQRRLSCSLDGWMVGDSIEHDVAGGAAAGLRTALITPIMGLESPVSQPTFTARSVVDAVTVILSGAYD